METYQAIVLGIVQGLTEFLPISSSGHLVLFQQLFGLEEPALFFDISVHVGTLAAVILFFYKDILSILISAKRTTVLLAKKQVTVADAIKDPDIRLMLFIVIGSVPTAIIGLFLNQIAERLFSSVFIVGITLILTGGVLALTFWLKEDGAGRFTGGKAFVIGIVQGLAVMPGISRSGSTIVTGLFLGLSRETAARFSFLLSIPAIVGAEILSLKDASAASLDVVTILGTITAAVVGYLSLKMLIYIVGKGRLYIFAPYCWLIGLTSLIIG